MFCRKFLFAAALAVVGALLAPATSTAGFKVRLSDGAGGAADADIDLTTLSGAGSSGAAVWSDSSYLNSGGIQTAQVFSLTYAGYSIAFTLSQSVNNPAQLSLQNTFVTRTGPGAATSNNQLSISLTNTGFTGPTTPGVFVSSFTADTPQAGQAISWSSSFSGANTEFDTTGPTQSGGTGAGGATLLSPTQWGQSKQQTLSGVFSTYSITTNLTFNGLTIGSFQGASGSMNNLITSVPGPSPLILLAGAVPFVGLLRRWRKKTAAEAETAPVAA